MDAMKKFSLKAKLMISIGSTVCIIFFLLSMITTQIAYENTSKLSEQYITERVQKEKIDITQFMDTSIQITKTLTHTVQTLHTQNLLTRDTMNALMKDILMEEPSLVDVWTVWEPNAFDGKDKESIGRLDSDPTGRYVALMNKQENKVILDKCYGYDTDAYYVQAKQTKKMYITEPAVYTVGNKDVLMVSITIPIIKNNVFLGAVGVDINVDTLLENNNAIHLLDTGYFTIMAESGIIITHPDSDLVGKQEPLLQTEEGKKVFEQVLNSSEPITILSDATKQKEDMHYVIDKISLGEDNNWILLASTPQKELLASAKHLQSIFILGSSIGVIIVLVLCYISIVLITKAIKEMEIIAHTIAEGNLTTILSEKLLKRKDEIGNFAHAFDVMQTNIRTLVSHLQKSSSEVMESATHLQSITTQATQTSQEMSKVIEQIAQGATDQAKDTESGNMQSMELGELMDTHFTAIKTLEEQAMKAADIVTEGTQTVGVLEECAKHTDIAMQTITHNISQTAGGVDKIRQVSELIAQIAQQTNLLALNASIEAARAGEMGKGFAVVAEEIRKLAEQTGSATKEISDAIEDLLEDSNQSVIVVGDLQDSVKEELKSVEATAKQFEMIAKTTKQILQFLQSTQSTSTKMENTKQEITHMMTNLAAIAEENAASTQETSASTEELTASLEEVEGLSDTLAAMAKTLNDLTTKFVL